MPPNPVFAKLQQELESERAARVAAEERSERLEREMMEARATAGSLEAALEVSRANMAKAGEEEERRKSLERSLETERASAARATAFADETKASLQEIRDSLHKVATHRDSLAAENADLQKALSKAQAKAAEAASSGDAAAKEIASLRSLIESERTGHLAELAKYMGSVAEAQDLRERLERLVTEYSSLKLQYARDVDGVKAAEPMAGVHADEGVWLDARAKAEIVRRIPRTDNNAPIFVLLGA